MLTVLCVETFVTIKGWDKKSRGDSLAQLVGAGPGPGPSAVVIIACMADPVRPRPSVRYANRDHERGRGQTAGNDLQASSMDAVGVQLIFRYTLSAI